MDKETLKKKIILGDRVISAISDDGKFRMALIRNTETAKTAQQNHKLPFLPAYFLSNQLAAASMMAVFLKGEERVAIDINSNGPISRIFTEAIQVGEARGFIHFDNNYQSNNILSFSEYIGIGLLKVSRILFDKIEPITGVVDLQNGNLAEDLEYYYHQSEQIPTNVLLDANFDADGMISLSGGFMIQALPGTSDKEINEVFTEIKNKNSFINLLSKEESVDKILSEIVPFPYKIIKNDRIDFFCRCSKEKFIQKLMTLGIKELQEMKADNHNELVCHYCNKHYYINENDFDLMIEELKIKSN